MTETIQPLNTCERAALLRTLRQLGKLELLEKIVADFAKRGVHALEGLGEDAEEIFDQHFWEVCRGTEAN
jgi:hypothetical protein